MNLVKLSDAVNLIIFSISIFAIAVNYLVRSVAYFELARLHKLRFSFLSFVPFLQFFVLGCLCDFFNLKKFLKKTKYAVCLTFFSLCFFVPSAISYMFPGLPLFTFKVFELRTYILNCLLLFCNIMFWLIYIDCLVIILKSYFSKCGLMVAFLSVFVVCGLDFIVSLALLRLINKKPVVCD